MHRSSRGCREFLAHLVTVLDDQIQATVYILYMFSWVDQAIIVVQTRFHGNIVFRESSA